MTLKECMLIKNDYFDNTPMLDGQPTGVVVHSTGCNNAWLKRYVQPVPEQEYYEEVLADIGKNLNGNSWNRPGVAALVHAMIGKNASGSIETYQTLPWTTCGSGVWRGRLLYAGAPCYEDTTWQKVVCYTTEDILLSAKELAALAGYGYCQIDYQGQKVFVWSTNLASYNLNPTARIQFEILEDDTKNEEYFNKVFTEAIELCAYLCKKYNLTVDSICSHNEAYEAGYGTQHVDPDHWLANFNKNMDWFRSEVQKLLNEKETSLDTPVEVYNFKPGDQVVIRDGVTKWTNGKGIAGFVFNCDTYVYSYDPETHKVRVTIDKTLKAVSGTLYDYQVALIEDFPPNDSEEIDYESQQPYEAPEQPEDKPEETVIEDVKANPGPSEEPTDVLEDQPVPVDIYPGLDETDNDYPRDDEPEEDSDAIESKPVIEPVVEPVVEPDEEPVEVLTWLQIILKAIKWLYYKIFKTE